MVFANFSSPGLNGELDSIREMTNTIIETGSDSQRAKKDMTDFVMLDYICLLYTSTLQQNVLN